MKPWIVYKRAAAVLFLVSRFADEAKARARASEDGAFCKHIDDLAPEAKKVLRLNGQSVVKAKVHTSV